MSEIKRSPRSSKICKIRLDRVTITGKFHFAGVTDIKTITEMGQIGWGFVITEDNTPEFRLERSLSPDVSENKAVLVPNRWQETWRLDTSNHLNADEKLKVVKALAMMSGKHLTRIDVAFDFINCEFPGMRHRVIKANTSEAYWINPVMGRGKGLETLYIGRRKSLSQYRYYDKLVEQKKARAEVPTWINNWERLEIQLRGKKASEWLAEAKKMLDCFKLPSYNRLFGTERAIIRGLIVDPTIFSELSAPSKRKYRKLMLTTFDSTYADRAYRTLRDNRQNLEVEVKSFLGEIGEN